MLRVLEGGCILLLLAAYFAYVIAPAMGMVSRRVRVGRRNRPLSRPAAIILIYSVLFASGAIVWRVTAPNLSAVGSRDCARRDRSRIQ